MAGFSRLYCIGGRGGFMGSDGLNPLDLQILVGDADRQWLEPVYAGEGHPLGSVRSVIPAKPNDPISLLDACVVFAPRLFSSCPEVDRAAEELRDVHTMDFSTGRGIPSSWLMVREQASPVFRKLNVFRADLVPVNLDEYMG